MFFDIAPNTPQLGRGTVVERAIRKYLVAEEPQERSEVRNALGKLAHFPPTLLHGCGWIQGDLAPFGGLVDQEQRVAKLVNFQHGAGNPRLGQQSLGIEQARKIKTGTGSKEPAGLFGKLLLVGDPVAVAGG